MDKPLRDKTGDWKTYELHSPCVSVPRPSIYVLYNYVVCLEVNLRFLFFITAQSNCPSAS